MFSKDSRYRKQPDVVTTDAQGRTRSSKALRILPPTRGVMEHIITQGERLDHLAHKYYQKSTRWWHLCDANPEFMYPPEMLGQGPLVTISIKLLAADLPPWNDLRRRLYQLVGMNDVVILEKQLIVPVGDGVTTEAQRAVQVVINRHLLSLDQVVAAIEELPFTVDGIPEVVGRVGKRILIPPKSVE